MNSNLSRTELSFDRGFYRVSELVRGLYRRSARDRNGYFGEEVARRGRTGPHRSHIPNLGHAKNHASKPPSIDRSLVDENGNRLFEDLDTAPGDDQGNGDREPGIEPSKAEV